MKEWLTLKECVALFREKKRIFSPINFVSLTQHYNIRRKHKSVGKRRKKTVKQEYLAADVYACFDTYRPKQRFTYTVSSPPPDGWLTLRQIAEYLGANVFRCKKLCSSLSIPARYYKGRRYAPLSLFEEHLSWRPISFVRKHRSEEWIKTRLQWQKEKNIEMPTVMRWSWGSYIFAPEFIHL